MKLKILHIGTAFFLVGGALFSANAWAQNEGLSPAELQDPNHLEYNLNDDKPLLTTEHDSKSKGLNRDSVSSHSKPSSAISASSKPKAEHSKTVSAKEDDDDALSFNFLYYIIQKFKISDLVDE